MPAQRFVTALVAAGCMLMCSGAGRAVAAELTGDAMLDELKHGGYVIYLRHDRTDVSRSDTDPIKLDDCASQRPLSAAGRAHAEKIGATFRSAGIPVGSLYASPVCRAAETAQLAFPALRAMPSKAMIYTLALPKEELPAAADGLKKLLATLPANQTNTVLVGHTTNLQEAAGVWPKKEGGALVFRPDGHGAFALAGSLEPADFERRAN